MIYKHPNKVVGTSIYKCSKYTRDPNWPEQVVCSIIPKDECPLKKMYKDDFFTETALMICDGNVEFDWVRYIIFRQAGG